MKKITLFCMVIFLISAAFASAVAYENQQARLTVTPDTAYNWYGDFWQNYKIENKMSSERCVNVGFLFDRQVEKSFVGRYVEEEYTIDVPVYKTSEVCEEVEENQTTKCWEETVITGYDQETHYRTVENDLTSSFDYHQINPADYGLITGKTHAYYRNICIPAQTTISGRINYKYPGTFKWDLAIWNTALGIAWELDPWGNNSRYTHDFDNFKDINNVSTTLNVNVADSRLELRITMDGVWHNYGFDAGSGTAVIDESTKNRINGTLNGGWNSTNNKLGSSAVELDGIDDEVSLANVDHTGLRKVSLSFWMYPRTIGTTTDTDSYPFSSYGGAQEAYLTLGGNASKCLLASIKMGNNNYCGFTEDAWYFVVYTYDNFTFDRAVLYINGVEVDNRSISGTLDIDDIMVGELLTTGTYCEGAYCNPYQGMIDEFTIYNKTLSQADVTSLWNSGNGLEYGYNTSANYFQSTNISSNSSQGNFQQVKLIANDSNASAVSYGFSCDNGNSWGSLINNSYVNCPAISNDFLFNISLFGTTSYSPFVYDVAFDFIFAPVNIPPNQSTPILNSTYGTNFTNENLTCYNQSTYDANGDLVTNIYNWYKNNNPLTVLNLPFEGSSNATYTKDYSGYGNDGSVVGATWNKTAGKIGGAYQLDGDDSVNVSPSSSLNQGDGSYAVEAWIRLASTPTFTQTILAKKTTEILYEDDFTGGVKPEWEVKSGSWAHNATLDAYSTNKTNDKNQVNLNYAIPDNNYVEFEIAHVDPAASYFDLLTRTTWSGDYVSGYAISYVKAYSDIYNISLLLTVWIDGVRKAQPDFVNWSELEGFSSVTDFEGHTIGIAVSGNTIKGYLDGTEILSGTDNNFTSGTSSVIANPQNGTFVFDNFKVQDSPLGNSPYELAVSSTQKARFSISDGTDYGQVLSNTTLGVGQWYYLVGVRDVVNDKLKIYVDGSLDGNITDPTTASCQNTEKVVVGDLFNGTIDEVKVYGHALTAEQIYQNYLDSKDGITKSRTIVSQETTPGEEYVCSITPNDGYDDGDDLNSSELLVVWSITFDVTSGEDGSEINNLDNITCNYAGFSWDGDPTNPYGPYGFPPGNWECIFKEASYYDRIKVFTADSDKIIGVSLSFQKDMTIEEHTWLEAIYNCIVLKDCDLWDLLVTINQTAANVWEHTKPTDTSVITSEVEISNILNSTSNITYDYIVNVPVKAGYNLGAYLPVRIGFWFMDETNESCYSQGTLPDGVTMIEPYCNPLVVQTIGPMGGSVTFRVDLRPNLSAGTYNVKRIIEIDPNEIWEGYGQEIIGEIVVTEDTTEKGTIGLEKTGEKMPSGSSSSSDTSSSGSSGGSGGGGKAPSITNINIYNITQIIKEGEKTESKKEDVKEETKEVTESEETKPESEGVKGLITGAAVRLVDSITSNTGVIGSLLAICLLLGGLVIHYYKKNKKK